jgi:hypothetical protein
MRGKKVPVVDVSRTVEVDGVSNADFSQWRVNSAILEYVNKFKTKVRIVNPETNKFDDVYVGEEDYDHGERLAEIYEQFMISYMTYHGQNAMIDEPGDISKKFDPEKVRAKLEKQFKLVEAMGPPTTIEVQKDVIIEEAEQEASEIK